MLSPEYSKLLEVNSVLVYVLGIILVLDLLNKIEVYWKLELSTNGFEILSC